MARPTTRILQFWFVIFVQRATYSPSEWPWHPMVVFWPSKGSPRQYIHIGESFSMFAVLDLITVPLDMIIWVKVNLSCPIMLPWALACFLLPELLPIVLFHTLIIKIRSKKSIKQLKYETMQKQHKLDD